MCVEKKKVLIANDEWFGLSRCDSHKGRQDKQETLQVRRETNEESKEGGG